MQCKRKYLNHGKFIWKRRWTMSMEAGVMYSLTEIVTKIVEAGVL